VNWQAAGRTGEREGVCAPGRSRDGSRDLVLGASDPDRPHTLVRVCLFALLGLLGLVSLVIQPWTGVVLVLVAMGGIVYILLAWKNWLPRRE
jgi:hypothetical protein